MSSLHLLTTQSKTCGKAAFFPRNQFYTFPRSRLPLAPRAGLDTITVMSRLPDAITTGMGYTMMAAFVETALTALPREKEKLAARSHPMDFEQQFGFLCRRAAPSAFTGAAVGLTAWIYTSQLGLAPAAGWTASALTVAGACFLRDHNQKS